MIVKCTECHHEAQATEVRPCDWCGGLMECIGHDYMDEPKSLSKLFNAALEDKDDDRGTED